MEKLLSIDPEWQGTSLEALRRARVRAPAPADAGPGGSGGSLGSVESGGSPGGDALAVWAVTLDAAWIPLVGARWLSREEREAAERRPTLRLRRRALAARIALRGVIGAELGVPPLALRFEKGTHGKPYLATGPLREAVERVPPHFDFNLSHSEGLALIAVSRLGRVGVDVQHEESGRPLEKLAARWFAPEECAAWLALPEAERRSAFFALWSCKEAVLKAVGTGFALSSRSFAVGFAADPDPDRGGPGAPIGALRPQLRRSSDERLEPGAWSLRQLQAAAHYAACVCWDGGAAQPQLRQWIE